MSSQYEISLESAFIFQAHCDGSIRISELCFAIDRWLHANTALDYSTRLKVCLH